jgi:hypothetical protein
MSDSLQYTCMYVDVGGSSSHSLEAVGMKARITVVESSQGKPGTGEGVCCYHGSPECWLIPLWPRAASKVGAFGV